jgi:hypothetical protein
VISLAAWSPAEAVRFLYRAQPREQTWDYRVSLWPVSHGSRFAPGAIFDDRELPLPRVGDVLAEIALSHTEAERAAGLIHRRPGT